MRLFITGVSGLLGLNLAWQLRDQFEITGAYLSHPVSVPGCRMLRLDMTSLLEAQEIIESAQPDVVINTVALTDVDRCESDPALAKLLNQKTALNAAQAASRTSAKLVHISTDHLFDGTKAWTTEVDDPSPLNTYAKTKYEGELSVREFCPKGLIVRTNFFGWGTSHRASFSDWVVRSLEDGRPLNMFTDSYFTPILVNDFIALVIRLVHSGVSGVINVGGADRVSKHEFALELARTFGLPTDRITPVSMDSHDFKAVRPRDMSLSSHRAESLLDTKMPTLSESLIRLKKLRADLWPQKLESATAGPASLPDEVS